MQSTAIVLTMFAALAVSAVAAADDSPEAAPVLTPAQVLLRAEKLLYRKPITVAFRVGEVDSVTVTMPDGSTHGDFRLVPASTPIFDVSKPQSFHVALSPEVVRTLKRIGIADLEKHFVGKSVKVRGQLSATSLNLPLSRTVWLDHRITVHDLDQFLAVSEAEASPDK